MIKPKIRKRCRGTDQSEMFDRAAEEEPWTLRKCNCGRYIISEYAIHQYAQGEWTGRGNLVKG